MRYLTNVRERFSRGKAAAGAALGTVLLVPAVAMAQSAPTNATELAESVNISEAGTAMFIVFGLLITLGVSLWVGNLIVRRFRPM